jgi:hypothetical protein
MDAISSCPFFAATGAHRMGVTNRDARAVADQKRTEEVGK